MSNERWWVHEPPHIEMTDARARALLNGASTKNNDEWIFVQANASTIIPKKTPVWAPKWDSTVTMPLGGKTDD